MYLQTVNLQKGQVADDIHRKEEGDSDPVWQRVEKEIQNNIYCLMDEINSKLEEIREARYDGEGADAPELAINKVKH